MRECEMEFSKRLAKAFSDGYNLGATYARRLYGMQREIEVEYIENANTELEFTRLDDGTIINYGRSLPF